MQDSTHKSGNSLLSWQNGSEIVSAPKQGPNGGGIWDAYKAKQTTFHRYVSLTKDCFPRSFAFKGMTEDLHALRETDAAFSQNDKGRAYVIAAMDELIGFVSRN